MEGTLLHIEENCLLFFLQKLFHEKLMLSSTDLIIKNKMSMDPQSPSCLKIILMMNAN